MSKGNLEMEYVMSADKLYTQLQGLRKLAAQGALNDYGKGMLSAWSNIVQYKKR